MKKFYVLQQVNPSGNGTTTKIALVTNPRIEGCTVYATKVGVIDADRSGFSPDTYVFKEVDKREFICVGNSTLEEITNPFQ